MQPAGRERLELWRESGEWWAGEAYREFETYIDEAGVRRTESRELPGIIAPPRVDPGSEDYSVSLEMQKEARRMKGWGEYTYPNRYESYRAKDARRQVHSEPIRILKSDVEYAPLHVWSGYAFGRGLIHATDLPIHAAKKGCPAIALVDPFSLMGALEFSKGATKIGIKPLIGSTLELESAVPPSYGGAELQIGGSIVLIARTHRGYQNLSKLITRCHLEEPRLYPLCRWERLADAPQDLICLTGGDAGPINQLLSRGELALARQTLQALIDLYGRENVYVEIERRFVPWEYRVNRLLLELAELFKLTPVAGGLVCYPDQHDFTAQDVLVCSDTLCLIEEVVGRKAIRDISQPQVRDRPQRFLNAEYYLRSPGEMRELFIDDVSLLHNTIRLAERCEWDVLPSGRASLPSVSENDAALLIEETWRGAKERHRVITPGLRKRLNYELKRITDQHHASHFMIIWDACRWARKQDILFSGRGSVVDSAVAYCLGLSRIDAYEHDLHFDRFMPKDHKKRPDIDIDFEAEHRDDVRNYLRDKYGHDRVATVAAVGTFGTRGIIREVGKALGMTTEQIGAFSKLIHGGVSPEYLERAFQTRPELRDSEISKERSKLLLELAPVLGDIPRNARAHSSGVVISDQPLSCTVPVMLSGVEDVPIIQWDKRSAKYYFDKFDILCLRGQDVLSGSQERIRERDSSFNVEQISLKDEETYRTMRSGNLIGIPQSASPAMRQAHIRLRTANLHDASLVQAGIRPGVGGAVKLNELIARRRGKPYSFLHPKLEAIMRGTYGLVVFQEQIDLLLQTFCQYGAADAEEAREAILDPRKNPDTKDIRSRVCDRIIANGFTQELAEHVYDLIAGFKGYGFAQGHALSFAEVSLRSIYCQQNYPPEYFASLLDAQPAGYYGPCTLANEARNRGVAILPPDVNRSDLRFRVESVRSDKEPKLVFPGGGLRVALTQISGLSKETRERMVAAPVASVGLAEPLERVVAVCVGSLEGTVSVLPPLPALSHGGERVPPLQMENLLPGAAHPTCAPEVCGGRNPLPGARGIADPPPARRGRVGDDLLDRESPHSGAERHSSLLEGGVLLESAPSVRCPRYRSFFDFVRRVMPERDELEQLILCGAFDSLHANRRALLWAIPRAYSYAETCRAMEGGLGMTVPEPEIDAQVEDFLYHEKAIYERKILGMDVRHHLMAFERERVKAKGVVLGKEISQMKNGEKAIVVGNPIRLRFPPTSSGKRVVFFDLEDESGLLNVTCFDDVYLRDGHAIVTNAYVTIRGEAQDRDGHMAFLAHRVFPYKPVLNPSGIAEIDQLFDVADFLMR